MKSYLFEPHLHTAEISPCGQVSAKDAVRLYYRNGYDGIVVTDHMHQYTFQFVSGGHKTRMDYFLSGYRIAREEGERQGITVLLGMELTFDSHPWDFLVYGFCEDFLYENEGLMDMSLQAFRALADEHSLFIAAAHPFRYPAPPPAWFIDGVEVYNANPRHHSRNPLAKKWAAEHQLIELAGSDFHQLGDQTAGINLGQMPSSSSEFAQMLRDGDIQSIVTGRDVVSCDPVDKMESEAAN